MTLFQRLDPMLFLSRHSAPSRRIVGLIALAGLVGLSGCGFHLRGSQGNANLPFKTLYIGLPENSPLGVELRRNIRASGDTQIVTDPKQAEARLDILSEVRDKSIQSLNSQGRIRQYTLFYRLNFRVMSKSDVQLLPPTEIVLKRDISFNESQVLAKESEEALLYRDMQSDLVQRILRRLAAIKPV
jgi:LPS-assembly lipoprotein